MNQTTTPRRPHLASPWLYFAATFVLTWLFWGLAILLGASMETPQGGISMLLGVCGPTVTGIVFTSLTNDKAGRRDYWRRVGDFKRIRWNWYLVIFLFVPALNLTAALLDRAAGGSGPSWGEGALNALSNPLSLLPSILFATLIPFMEELGWRGYVLDRLQAKQSALVSSLMLGVVWAVWHLPLFLIEGSYQASLGLGTPAFWLFMVGLVALSLPFTWIYNNTRRSILGVVLFHAMVNFTGELILLSQRADTLTTLLWVVAAIGITVLWSAKTLARGKAEQPLALAEATARR